jgi:hypothetical protein
VPKVARERRHDVHHLLLDEGIEGGGGLVGDEERRAHDEDGSEHDPLAHAARVLVRVGAEATGGIGDAHALEHFEGALARLAFREPVVELQRLHHLEADRERGIERDHRLLEDHADVAAANRAHARLGRLGEILALEHHAACLDGSDRRQQAQHRAPDHRLAAPRLAHERHHAAGLDGERDLVDHAPRRCIRLADGDRQALDGERRLVHRCFIRGSNLSRRASPKRLMPRSVTEMLMPGTSASHGAWPT